MIREYRSNVDFLHENEIDGCSTRIFSMIVGGILVYAGSASLLSL